ncbi:hypothetical protein [uncultured Jatrophihabitans sp.]|uniref:hypothetical protein n=1 Tax=uncultured Jatrophihabitans sp. TaxID=1610747 RepID=UPI0035C97130
MSELQETVAHSADLADLHAPVPTLLLELQTLLGALTSTVTAESDRGRRPFRPGPEWAQRVGELAYGVYLLADQSEVDVEPAVLATARQLMARAQQARAAADREWPFQGQ